MTESGHHQALRRVAFLNGATCAGIGMLHAAFGARSVVGLGEAGTNEDSQERFYGGLFAVYGVAWLAAARGEAPQLPTLRWLAAGMAAGGVGRTLGMLRSGLPHPFWRAMTVVELVVPAMVLQLTRGANPERLRGDPHLL